LWQIAYILSFFALMTIFLEIYLNRLNFNWAWVLVCVILIFTYLTAQYIFYKERET
jgi:uncharacterized membrane protein